MPLVLSTKAPAAPNLCLGCNEPVRRPLRLHNYCEREWNRAGAVFHLEPVQCEIVQQERKLRGITPEGIEFRRKLSVSRPF